MLIIFNISLTFGTCGVKMCYRCKSLTNMRLLVVDNFIQCFHHLIAWRQSGEGFVVASGIDAIAQIDEDDIIVRVDPKGGTGEAGVAVGIDRRTVDGCSVGLDCPHVKAEAPAAGFGRAVGEHVDGLARENLLAAV